MKISASGGIAAVLGAALVAACGAQSEEGLLASARSALAAKDDKTALIQVKNVLQADPKSAEARFLLGSVLYDQGDFPAAELELRKAQVLKFSPEQLTPKLAAVLLQQTQYRKLIEEFGATRLSTPTATADLQTSLAYAQAMAGDKTASDAALKAALAADPGFAPAQVAQARFLAGAGDADAALARVDEIVQRDPHDADAWRLRGDIVVFLKSQPDEALVDYRKALAADSTCVPAHMAILTILMQERKADDAEKQLTQMRKLTGNNVQAVYIEAMIAYIRQDMARTRQLAQQLLKVVPENTSVLLLAGGAELGGGSLVQAQTYLEHAVELAPDARVARRLLVTTYLRSNQTDRALSTLRPGGREIAPDLYAQAGEAYLQAGDLKAAEDYFDKAAKLDPTDTGSRTSLAMTHLIGGDTSLGFDELQEIASSDKGTSADVALVGAYMKRGEFDKALAADDVLRRKQPNQPLPPHLRGRIQLSRKDFAGARQSFEQALAISPAYYPSVASLAELDVEDGKLPDARKRLEKYAKDNPQNSQVLISLSLVPGLPPDDAVALLKKAIAVQPTQSTARLLLVDRYLDAGNLRLAGAAAQDAAAALPDRPEVIDALGRVQQASGDANQAIATFGKVVEKQPKDPRGYLRLAEAQRLAGSNDAARDTLAKGLAIKPDLLEAQRKLVFVDIALGKGADALGVARTVQRQRPGESVGYLLEGDIAASAKDWATAAAVYRRGLQQAPSSDLAIKLDSMLLALNASADAVKFQVAWRQQHPDDAGFLFHLGDVAMLRRDYPAAHAQYLAVVALQPTNAAAFNNLAWVSSVQNEDAALGYAEKANQLAPDQPAYLDTLAVILTTRKQYDRALTLQKRAIELAPTNANFQLDLAKLYLKAGNKSDARTQLDQLAGLGSKFAGQDEVSTLLKDL